MMRNVSHRIRSCDGVLSRTVERIEDGDTVLGEPYRPRERRVSVSAHVRVARQRHVHVLVFGRTLTTTLQTNNIF